MSSITRLLALVTVSGLLASCQNGGKSLTNDPYVANFGDDGGYRPYPNQPGVIQGSSRPTIPTYETPPTPPPPQNDPYAFSGPSTPAPKPSSASSARPKSTVKSSPNVASAPKKSPSTPSKAKSTASTAKKKSSSGGGSYTVLKGDTLSAIARKRHTSVAKIKAANRLSSDLIRPGQTLKIP